MIMSARHPPPLSPRRRLARMYAFQYPMKPPSVMMLTPNGRFACSRRLCLSMSDFHPESWNPMWSVSTILMGLYSFMLDNANTLGSVTSSTAQARERERERVFPKYSNYL